MNKKFLKLVGLGFYNPDEFKVKNIRLRDGRDAILWVHRDTGHGILDMKFWPEEITGDYYSENYRDQHSIQSDGAHTDSNTHFELFRDINKKQYDFIKPHLTGNTKYLEIGSSFGGILSQVVNDVSECHAIEPNIRDVDYVQSKHPNIKIYRSKIEDTNLEDNYYDTVASIEVLEHMVSVEVFLQSCFNSLKVGGNLILEVPNHRDVLYSCYKASAYKDFYYHKAHIHYFTDKSLINICDHYGFTGTVDTFQVYPFFNHVNWCLNNEPQTTGRVAMSTPKPTDGFTVENKAINNFYKRVEQEYDTLINKYKLGGELVFKGTKNG